MSLRRDVLKRRVAFDHLESRQLLTLTMTPVHITATQNSTFTGAVASLLDSNLNASPSDFNNPPGSVQIDWGDGQTTSGQVVGPLLPGVFEVDGSHNYAQAGTFSTLIAVSDSSGHQASTAGSASVASQPFVINVNTISGAPGNASPPMV